MKNLTIILGLTFLSLFHTQAKAQCDECADLKETIEWIEGKVAEYGSFVFFYRGENEIGEAVLDASGNKCKWEYSFSERYYDDPEKGKGSKPRVYKKKFKLKDITEIVMVPVEGEWQTKTEELYYALEFRTFNDENKIKEKKKKYGRSKDNELAIYISDKEIAERMVIAMNCALCDCNKGEVPEEVY